MFVPTVGASVFPLQMAAFYDRSGTNIKHNEPLDIPINLIYHTES
ncbi:MAG TPA: hypothetical protein VKJ45_06135 [Blastocatellia bacterium]|nr:hypothetical protein [Blastocatellia bacterium]